MGSVSLSPSKEGNLRYEDERRYLPKLGDPGSEGCRRTQPEAPLNKAGCSGAQQDSQDEARTPQGFGAVGTTGVGLCLTADTSPSSLLLAVSDREGGT